LTREADKIMLFHVCDELGIERFDPRASEYTSEPVVWAIDGGRIGRRWPDTRCTRRPLMQSSAATSERWLLAGQESA
jgi:hypothetical protein